MFANTKYWLCIPIWHTPFEVRVRVPGVVARWIREKAQARRLSREIAAVEKRIADREVGNTYRCDGSEGRLVR